MPAISSGCRYAIAALVCFSFSRRCPAQQTSHIELLGTFSFPGDAVDLSGDSTLLENGEPRSRLGGFSALDYSGSGSRFAVMPDRGPDDGAVGYGCRVQFLDIQIQPGDAEPVAARVVETLFFEDSRCRPFTGSSAAIEPTSSISHRFDPEGFRFSPAGTMFVSDEYGPELIEFSSSGKELRRFELPGGFRVKLPSADKLVETRANKFGRASNRGMECLALSHAGKSLIGLMQSPLIQDGTQTGNGTISGRNCRLVQVELDTGRTLQHVYQMDRIDNGNSEIVAFGPDEFLVLERDSRAGEKAEYRKLIRIGLKGATDVTQELSLPTSDLPDDIHPVKREVFLDLLDPQWHLVGATMPEKIEGLTFGPTLADGRRTLLISTDNDFESTSPSWIWVFALGQ